MCGYSNEAKVLEEDQKLEISLQGSSFKVKILDVGQASCSAIYDSKDRLVGYFDVGAPLGFHKKTFPASFHTGMSSDTDFVVLSHWDYDHYSLALSHMRGLLSKKWFAPLQDVGPGAKHLQKLLGGNLVYLRGREYTFSGSIKIHGLGSRKNRNQGGYVMRVPVEGGAVLLPGDADYCLMASCMTSGLVGLCVTHHGGEGAGKPPKAVGSHAKAVISSGMGNRYKHPSQQVIDSLREEGWDVRRTDGDGGKRGDVWLP